MDVSLLNEKVTYHLEVSDYQNYYLKAKINHKPAIMKLFTLTKTTKIMVMPVKNALVPDELSRYKATRPEIHRQKNEAK